MATTGPIAVATASHRRAWLIVAMLCGINCINFLDKVSLGLVAVPVMADFHLSHAAFGFVNSGFFLLYVISASALSWLGNRYSSRSALTVVVALWALLQFPVAFGGVLVLIACRLALGVAEAPSMPFSLDNLQEWFPDVRRSVPTMVLYASPAIAGIILIPTLNAMLVHLGWRVLFLALAAVGAAMAIVWGMYGRTGPLRNIEPAAQSTDTTHVPYKRILLSGTFVGSAAAMFVAQWTIGLASAWVPAYLEEGLGFSKSGTGPILGLIFIGVAASMIGYGIVSQQMSKRGIGSRGARVWLTAAMFVLGAISLLFATRVHGAAAAAALFGIGIALSQGGFGLGPVLLGESVPETQRSAVFGFLYTCGAIGAILSPSVFGVLIGQTASTRLAGYDAGILVTVAVFALAAILLIFGVRPRKDAARWHVASQRG